MSDRTKRSSSSSSPTKSRKKEDLSTSPSSSRKADPPSPSKQRRKDEPIPTSSSSPTKSRRDDPEKKKRESSRASKDTDKWLEQELAKIKEKPPKEKSSKERRERERDDVDPKSSSKKYPISSKSSKKVEKESEEEEENYEEDFEEYEEDFEPEEDEKQEEKREEKQEEKQEEKKQEEVKVVVRQPSPEPVVQKEEGPSEEELEEEIVVQENVPVVPSGQKPRPASPTLRAVRAAIDAENAAATPSSKYRGNLESVTKSGGKLGARKVVDVRTSKVQQEALRRMTRARELQKIITFESVVVDLLDMPPLDEYGKYIRYFGRSDAAQQATQTNDADDKCNKDIQTNPPQSKNRGVQVPGDGEEDDDTDKQFDSMQPLDTVRLGRFLMGAAAVVESLLDENVGDILSKKYAVKEDSEWSSSYIKLQHQILEKRVPLQVVFSQYIPHQVVVLYSSDSTSDRTRKSIDAVENLGIICVWNLDSPDVPTAVLATYLSPNSLCVPSRNTVVVGTVEGSLLVWDLREPPSMHKNQHVQAPNGSTKGSAPFAGIPLRYPTYSTDGLKETHHSPIERIQRIGITNTAISTSKGNTNVNKTKTAENTSKGDPLDLLPIFTDEDGGSAFKIVSLDESGIVNIWVVVELDSSDSSTSNSDMDLHVAIGGRVRMVHTAGMHCSAQRAFDFALHPLDPSRILVAGDNGKLTHGARLIGTKLGTLPQSYTVRPNAVDVVVVATHPSLPPSPCACLILSGCSDGFVVLHHIERSIPIRTWDIKSKILGIVWSATRALVFFVMTQRSMFIFDLDTSLEGPVVEYDLHNNGTSKTSIPFRWTMDTKMLPILHVGDSSVHVHRVKDLYLVLFWHSFFCSLRLSIYSAALREEEVNNLLSNLLSTL